METRHDPFKVQQPAASELFSFSRLGVRGLNGWKIDRQTETIADVELGILIVRADRKFVNICNNVFSLRLGGVL